MSEQARQRYRRIREREREKRASNQRVARVNREAKKEGWEGRTSWKFEERKRGNGWGGKDTETREASVCR